MVKTLEELRQSTNDELLEMYKESAGFTNDFKNHFGTDFTYSNITKELEVRGFENGYYQPVKVMTFRDTDKNERKNIALVGSVKKKWEKMFKGNKHEDLYISAALQQFMDDYTKGRVRIMLDTSINTQPSKAKASAAKEDAAVIEPTP